MVININTPYDILKFMRANISYGWVGTDGRKRINDLENFRIYYRTMSLEDVLKYCAGVCIEQVYLMKKLFDKLNIDSKMFCTRIYEDDSIEKAVGFIKKGLKKFIKKI